jgi:hypothetical protein
MPPTIEARAVFVQKMGVATKCSRSKGIRRVVRKVRKEHVARLHRCILKRSRSPKVEILVKTSFYPRFGE